MHGKYGGLSKKLEEYTGKSVYSIHCMAHRLQLAIGHALENVPIFQEMERLVDGIFSFYNNKGHKRKAHLNETSIALEMVYYQYSGLFIVRWISSEFLACSKIFKSFDVLLMDLESISADQTFDDLTRQHARGLRTKLIQKNNQAFFHMALDILNSLKILSTFLQSSAGTLIEKMMLKNLKLNLNKRIMEVTNAKYGKCELPFYDECTCVINEGGAIRRRKCTTDDLYDRADSIEYKGVTLSTTGNILLDTKACIEAILIQVDEYFAGRNLADFDVFLPSKIPSESGSTLNYGLVSIRNLASALGFSRVDY